MGKQKQTQPQEQESAIDFQPKKKGGAGAVLGSILFFILTLLLSLLLLCSAVAYGTLSQNSVSSAVSKMDLSQLELKENGTTQKLGRWIYDWYMQDAPNLTPEYAEALVEQPEVKEAFCDYLTDLSAYLTKKSDTLPELQAETYVDLMQQDLAEEMEELTDARFAEADRRAILYASEDDVPAWNQQVSNWIGQGFGKVAIRFFCTLPGVITAGVLTVVSFVLWLILAIKGHWRKGQMLTASGVAIAIPGLLELLCSGLLLLLVCAMQIIDSLSFAKNGLPTLLLPGVWFGLILALCGIILASVGIFTNSIVKVSAAKQKQAEQLQQELEATEAQETSEPELEQNPSPNDGEFVYSHMPQEADPVPTASLEPGTCPYCGAQNAPNSRFCGSCGQSMQ